MSDRSNPLVAALDIGSSRICCFIAEDEGEGVMRVLGTGHQAARGVRGGAIVDMDAAEEAVRATVHAAETMAGETVRSVVVSLSGGGARSERFGVAVDLGGEEVGDAAVEQARAQARRHAPPEGHERVHLIPVDFEIDGSAGIREPRGIFGDRLVAGFHAVSASRGRVRTLRACAARCHLDVDAVVLAAYASGRAVLAEDELNMGAVCIDMGAGTTDIAVFARGALVFADSVPVGGAHVTNDIACVLTTTPTAAERLKTMHGSAIEGGDGDELLDVPEIGEGSDAGPNHVPRTRLVEIVRARLEETFALAGERLDAAGLDAVASRRVVLCGGASALCGARETAARVLDRSVRVGRPRQLRGLAEAAAGAASSACAGLLLGASAAASDAIAEPAPATAPSRVPLGWVGRWLQGNF